MGPTGDAARADGDRSGGVVRVRGIELGAGRPEIIVPLTGADERSVLAQAERARTAPARIIEWRADLLAPSAPGAEHRERVLGALPALREALAPEQALLLTVRTAAEGGGRDLPDTDLAELLRAGIALRGADGGPLVDLVDVETARAPEAVGAVIRGAHEAGLAVVGSFHDFAATPSREDILATLRAQRDLGADVAKIAVTPRTAEDVLVLLAASLEAARDGAGPHLAISMGSLGAVSRVAAEVFGSCATFATAGEASAPGQLGADEVCRMLAALRP
ncbi:type I 3-dehydroquinate dehydratase [Brachybacterium sp. MASK1Z-5]|uniref:3-dehydroquinate dehydratase n=1 Tax=Brachybacterium halotolerans TaxID=2795215 RepID=A0ABS1B617_9MICO|nr:type I 3-dehydroquinate dehydratase [Brachybacterium halotolerans]MBK0329947.1 type I 3-dehydroquinate dehydratase [Brachybacterium halotolerans]